MQGLNSDINREEDPTCFLEVFYEPEGTLYLDGEAVATKSPARVPFFFQVDQRVRVDSGAEVSLHELVRCGEREGVRAEEVGDVSSTATLALAAENLERLEIFSRDDPYVRVSRRLRDSSYLLVYKSEVVRKTFAPSWRPFEVSVKDLNGGDMDAPLRFEVLHFSSGREDASLGHVDASVAELMRDARWPLVNPAKVGVKRGYTSSGTLVVASATLSASPSMVHYMRRGGLQLQAMMALDFTASNGTPTQPQSLHHVDAAGSNVYVEAIRHVGGVLSHYGTGGVTAMGFGARVPPEWKVSHCFALGDAFELANAEAVVDAYRETLGRVKLYGPTVLQQVLEASSNALREGCYGVLLIVTDGDVTDMMPTYKELIRASRAPLSIVVVGVGTMQFPKMHSISSHDHLLDVAGEKQVRQNVSFVKAEGVRNALARVPQQLAEWMAWQEKGAV